MRETSHRLFMIYGLSDWQDGSVVNGNKETVCGAGFGRKIRGSVLDGMPVRHLNGDVKEQLD